MLKKSVLAFTLAATSALGLLGCGQQQPTSNVHTGPGKNTSSTSFDIEQLEAMPATSYTAIDGTRTHQGFATTVDVENAAGCFNVASALAKNFYFANHRGICWGTNGYVVAELKAREGLVNITNVGPQPK